MKTISLRSQIQFPGCFNTAEPSTSPPMAIVIQTKPKSHKRQATAMHRTNHTDNYKPIILQFTNTSLLKHPTSRDSPELSPNRCSRFVMLGAVSLGVALLLMAMDDGHKALALGPEGPLMEEFWDNVRRYALYALTVSTGALYTILQPIVELLKNPVSAVLVLVIFGGSIYIISQVLYAMVGVTDFSYDYGY